MASITGGRPGAVERGGGREARPIEHRALRLCRHRIGAGT